MACKERTVKSAISEPGIIFVGLFQTRTRLVYTIDLAIDSNEYKKGFRINNFNI